MWGQWPGGVCDRLQDPVCLMQYAAMVCGAGNYLYPHICVIYDLLGSCFLILPGWDFVYVVSKWMLYPLLKCWYYFCFTGWDISGGLFIFCYFGSFCIWVTLLCQESVDGSLRPKVLNLAHFLLQLSPPPPAFLAGNYQLNAGKD